MKSRPRIASQEVQPILLSPDEAIVRLGKLLVLDVQNPIYATVIIPKAQRLNVDIELKNIPRDQPILVTCLTGKRSLIAAQQLLQKGYGSVYVLKGGVMAWKRASHITQLTKLPA